MQIDPFLSYIRAGGRVAFGETMRLIDQHYEYRPVAFTNGPPGDQIVNAPGTNEGSCKIFSFARLHGLNQSETLTLFGDYYWDDVLGNPKATNHANIRTFMRHGWGTIHFSGEPLSPRRPLPVR